LAAVVVLLPFAVGTSVAATGYMQDPAQQLPVNRLQGHVAA
jgi:hypothetical protein